MEILFPRMKVLRNFRSHGIRPMIKFRSCATENVHVIVRAAKKLIYNTCNCNLWKDRALNKETKVRLMRAIVRPVATYGGESWTLKASDKKRIAGFEMTAYRRMLRIS